MGLRTRLIERPGVGPPVVRGGMGRATVPTVVAAVSDRALGPNRLLFASDQGAVEAVPARRPPVFSGASSWSHQDLRPNVGPAPTW